MLLSENNINEYRIEQFIRDLTTFHNIKIGIRGKNINNIQKAVVNVKKWNNENELNNVPNLDLNGVNDNLQNKIENILYEKISKDKLNLSGNEFKQESGLEAFIKHQESGLEAFIDYQGSGLEAFIDNQTINSKFLQTLKKISINIIYNSLKETLSDEEFELGYQIYKLENSFSKEFFNLFINNPGIDNFPFNIEEFDINEWKKIISTEDFLEYLSQIGLNENLTFDYNSEIIIYYELNNQIQEQSFQIRDQLYNSIDKIKRSLENLKLII